jgi:hypothetical protein
MASRFVVAIPLELSRSLAVCARAFFSLSLSFHLLSLASVLAPQQSKRCALVCKAAPFPQEASCAEWLGFVCNAVGGFGSTPVV